MAAVLGIVSALGWALWGGWFVFWVFVLAALLTMIGTFLNLKAVKDWDE